MGEVEDDAGGYVAALESLEDFVDVGEGLEFDVGFDLAVCGEGKGFGHVVAGADEGAADGDAVGDYVE